MSTALKCQALRRLLADGQWHTGRECEEVGGRRFGGRVHEIRRGQDGQPALFIECSNATNGDSMYRARPYAEGETPPPPKASREELEAEVMRLRAELERLKRGQMGLFEGTTDDRV